MYISMKITLKFTNVTSTDARTSIHKHFDNSLSNIFKYIPEKAQSNLYISNNYI